MWLQTEPLRLQRQRSSAGEGVVERGKTLAIEQISGSWIPSVVSASTSPALSDLSTCSYSSSASSLVFSHLTQILDQLEQSLPFLVLGVFGRE